MSILRIKNTDYEVKEYSGVQIPGSRGFSFAKLAPDMITYDVLIGMNPQDHSCECLGFLRHGHCKHIDAARRLAGVVA